ncbi:MAG: protein kinase [Sandaracinaceae bacterium]|nr:protein kinase [Sandaracinaceae bacterium]
MTQGAHTTPSDSTGPALRAILREVARPRQQTPPPALVAGRYRVGERLGNGGMGTVYRATDERLGRQVALKWMHFHDHDGVSDEAFSRFVREARAAALVRHPNVVQVLDVSAEASTPFIIMELLEGESLHARIAGGRVPWPEAVSIAQGMLDGLGALHAAGVVHRDIKPSNVFLARRTGMAPLVKVLDLGVAHMTEGEALAGLTRTGTQLGTPAYMPLEQLRGERVDARADLYAVGVVLYEMVVGARPYSARTAADLAVQLATSTPPRLAVSAQNDVLQRALARDAAQRFQSAGAFKAALAAEGRRLPMRRRGALWVLAALVAGGIALAMTQLGREPAGQPSGTVATPASEEPSSQGQPLPGSTASPPELPDVAAPGIVHRAPVDEAAPAPAPQADTARAASGPRPRRAGTRGEMAPPAGAAPQEDATREAAPTSPRLDVAEFERRAPPASLTLSRDEF